VRAYALHHKITHARPSRRTPSWPRTAAWNTARRHYILANPVCIESDGTCRGLPECHDIVPYSRLSAAQRKDFAFLLRNFQTLCRRHHRLLHFHSPGRGK